MIGGNGIGEVIQIIRQVVEIFKGGDFPLRKLAVNCVEILYDVPISESEETLKVDD